MSAKSARLDRYQLASDERPLAFSGVLRLRSSILVLGAHAVGAALTTSMTYTTRSRRPFRTSRKEFM